MDDRDIEQLLARYRPDDPPAELRERVLSGAVSPAADAGSTWPWAVAAAALLALTVGLHAASHGNGRDPLAADPAEVDRIDALTQQFGGDARARAVATWMIREEIAARLRLQPSAVDVLSEQPQ